MLARQFLIGVMALLVSPAVVHAQGLTLPTCPAAMRGDFGVGCQRETVTFEPERSSAGTVPKLRLALRSEWIDVPVRASGQNGSQQTTKASGPLWHAAVWGVVGGVAGFFAGGFIGEGINKDFNHQTDGMGGAVIGCISGAALGAFLLAKFGP